MSKFFANAAGAHIGANLAGFHVGSRIAGTQPRVYGDSMIQAATASTAETPVVMPAPIEARIEAGEVTLEKIGHAGQEAFLVASAVEEANAAGFSSPVSQGELAS